MRDKYSLPKELDLRLDGSEEDERVMFEKSRNERRADEDARRRKVVAEVGRSDASSISRLALPPAQSAAPAQTKNSRVKGQTATSAAAGGSFSLRSKLLQNNARRSDPFLRESRMKPPDVKTLGVKFKK